MRLLRALVICEDPELRERIQELLGESADVVPALVLQHYPERREAARHLNLCRPELILLAVDRLQPAIDFVKELETISPDVVMLGISRLQDPRALAELMRLGIRDCVAAPLNRQRFLDAVHRLAYHYKDTVLHKPAAPLVCFLPARGGSGTSTLACNLSSRMALLPGLHVLLADLDTSSGLSRFLFELTTAFSLGELIDSGHELDGENWQQCVATAGKLWVLHGGIGNLRKPPTASHMGRMIEVAASQYDVLCADLTGGMETHSIEALRRARRILLVSTSEAPSIALTREKIEFLEGMALNAQLEVVLTLGPDAPEPDIQVLRALLGAPVAALFDLGEKSVRRALEAGKLIDPKSPTGRQLDQFARELALSITAGRIPVDTLKA